ncbi:hypothetical protein [Cryptosporangium minutisporangium]|uniref:Uncharacterized protein n=1 Tax=Cryptosporangium minutisporangium TaxID=113569 RepID=A0ABP6T0C3_9ACTN
MLTDRVGGSTVGIRRRAARQHGTIRSSPAPGDWVPATGVDTSALTMTALYRYPDPIADAVNRLTPPDKTVHNGTDVLGSADRLAVELDPGRMATGPDDSWLLCTLGDAT